MTEERKKKRVEENLVKFSTIFKNRSARRRWSENAVKSKVDVNEMNLIPLVDEKEGCSKDDACLEWFGLVCERVGCIMSNLALIKFEEIAKEDGNLSDVSFIGLLADIADSFQVLFDHFCQPIDDISRKKLSDSSMNVTAYLAYFDLRKEIRKTGRRFLAWRSYFVQPANIVESTKLFRKPATFDGKVFIQVEPIFNMFMSQEFKDNNSSSLIVTLVSQFIDYDIPQQKLVEIRNIEAKIYEEFCVRFKVKER